MSEEHIRFLMHFLNRMADDKRLNTSHMSLCFAMIICWNDQKNKLPFKIAEHFEEIDFAKNEYLLKTGNSPNINIWLTEI